MNSGGNDNAVAWIEECSPLNPFVPFAEYEPAGDCIEFFLSNEPFYGKRLDGWVTVYYGENSGEVVGGLIKGIKTSLLPRFPGLKIDIVGDSVRVVFLLRAPALQMNDPEKQAVYKAMIDKTEESKVGAMLAGT